MTEYGEFITKEHEFQEENQLHRILLVILCEIISVILTILI